MTAFVYDDTLTVLPVHHSAGLHYQPVAQLTVEVDGSTHRAPHLDSCMKYGYRAAGEGKGSPSAGVLRALALIQHLKRWGVAGVHALVRGDSSRKQASAAAVDRR